MIRGILAGILVIAIIVVIGAAFAIHRREKARRVALLRRPPPDFDDDDDELADTNPTLTPPSGIVELDALLDGDGRPRK